MGEMLERLDGRPPSECIDDTGKEFGSMEKSPALNELSKHLFLDLRLVRGDCDRARLVSKAFCFTFSNSPP